MTGYNTGAMGVEICHHRVGGQSEIDERIFLKVTMKAPMPTAIPTANPTMIRKSSPSASLDVTKKTMAKATNAAKAATPNAKSVAGVKSAIASLTRILSKSYADCDS